MGKNEKLLPIVKSSDGHIRKGRGFSSTELRHVGLDVRRAKKINIPIDARRKTSYVENIERLRNYLKNKSFLNRKI